MASTPAAPESVSPATVGTFGRLFGALFSPKQTFADIARRPTWIAPIVLICLISIAITAIFGQRVGWRSFMQKQFASNKSFEQLPPDQQQQRLDQAVKYAPIFGYVGAVVGTPVAALVVAGILLALFNTLSSAGLEFKASLAIVSHAWMPGVVGGLIGILVLFLKSPETVDIEHLVASNLGAVVSDESPKWLMSLATSIDLFTFWTIALMAIGFSAANHKKIKVGSAAAYIVLVWAGYVLVKVGWAAIFS